MAVNSIRSPFPAFLDADGNALEGGKIYIGTFGANPITSTKLAYWDESLTVTASQPIRTVGGIPNRNSSPARIYVENTYSIAVYDSNDALVFSADVGESETATVLDNYVTVSSVGPQTALDVTGKQVVLCDTNANNVGLSGFVGGVTGQQLTIVRNKTTFGGDVIINDNAGTGNQDIALVGGVNATIDRTYDVVGGMLLVFDGSVWVQAQNRPLNNSGRIIEITAAGNVDALDLFGVRIVRCDSSAGDITIRGAIGGVDGQLVTIFRSVPTNSVTIDHNYTTGNDKFLCTNNTDVVLSTIVPASGGATFVYDTDIWRMINMP